MPNESSTGADQTERNQTSHDKIFKTLFRTFLKDLIELVHPGLASVLDLDHPKFLEQETLTELPEGERSLADLVAEVSARVAEALMVLIHVEVEGKFRKLIDERMWRYSLQFGLKHRCSVITNASSSRSPTRRSARWRSPGKKHWPSERLEERSKERCKVGSRLCRTFS